MECEYIQMQNSAADEKSVAAFREQLCHFTEEKSINTIKYK